MEIVFLILIAVAVVAFIFYNRMKRAQSELGQERESIAAQRAELEPLRRYQAIENAEDAARKIIHDAESRSTAMIDAAKEEAKATTTYAKEKAQTALNTAIEQSGEIVANARAEAEKIAGDALLAKDNADQYSKVAKTMKNIIDGYGDEYLIPNRSVLDDLADEFDHKEAGAELKKARKKTRTLIKEGAASECDYKEQRRRETALHFVLDAFNGKVDSALSKVKHDNYGKLKQEIEDAFNIVNHNGEAFKDARVTKVYLDSRLLELKWAVAAMELRRQDREEQRRIKEEMREEERARREFEKARKKAEKEEKLIAKDLNAALKQLESAKDEQKLEFENKIAELQAKLREANAKSQHAMSMAQQTKQGHVYIISNVGSFGQDVYKIGLTRRLEPLQRVKELGDASVPFEFDVHAMLFSRDAPALENELHKVFQANQVNKVNPRKEFFRVGLKEIRSSVERIGVEAHWTMTAEAREYRETQKLEAEQQRAMTA